MLWKGKYKIFLFFPWTRYQKITWSIGWGSPNISYHSAKFGGHRHCGSVDISFFHLSCDHIIKNSREFEDWVHPPQVTTLASLMAVLHLSRDHQLGSYYSANVGDHRYWERADISFLSLSRDHVIKRSRDFEGGVTPLQITSLSNLVATGIVEGQI